MSLPFHEGEAEDHPFWQRRFYDFNVWSAKKVREKLDYMHANPVKRKLVPHSKDWPWSSWSYYEKGENGLIAIEFAGAERNERAGSAGNRKNEPHTD